jgi:protein SCO1/2
LRRVVLVLVALALGVALVWMTWVWSPLPEGTGERGRVGALPLPPGGDFVLQSWQGPVGLADLRGKLVLIFFGYTWCPDVCPTNLALIGKALDALNPGELEAVQVLFVSVDPARDTPERLRDYGRYFHPRILGVTGTPEALERVARQYGAAYRVAPPEGGGTYLVDHSALTYLVGPDGRLVETLNHAAPAAEILTAIRRWLPVKGG